MQTSISQVRPYLTFRLNDEIFAAGVEKVLEILEIPKITRVPRSPDYMRGVINLRGSVLPVIDIRRKFGLHSIEDTINTCIIVMNIEVNGNQLSVGAIVDAVQEVMEIDESTVQPTPSVGSRYEDEFIQGMVKRDDHFIMKLDVDKVLSSAEANILQTVSENTVL